MILKIAWRNILRNRRRTMIIGASIIVGVAALMVYDSFMKGMGKQMINLQIQTDVGHIHVSRKGFNDDKTVNNFLPAKKEVWKKLNGFDFIKAYAPRIETAGMINSAGFSSGVNIVGVDPEKEVKVTRISEFIVDGNYFSDGEREIVLGEKLADKLEVEIGDKLVLQAAELDGSIGAELFRLTGTFVSGSDEYDKNQVYVTLDNARKILGLGDKISQFVVVLDDQNKVETYKSEIAAKFDDSYEILSFADLMPMIVSYEKQIQQFSLVIYFIIIIAILFGVINTMLMSVMERIQEIGVLMALGMKRGKIFIMIIEEAIILGLIGSVIGFVVGGGVLLMFPNGLDLSVFSESLSSLGIGSRIHPVFDETVIFNALVLMPLSAAAAAIYPALKAIKLLPTDAMRYV